MIKILAMLVLLAGCSNYVYSDKQAVVYNCHIQDPTTKALVSSQCVVEVECRVEVISWSDIDSGGIAVTDCNVKGSAAGRKNVTLQKALQAVITAAEASK